MKDVDFFDTLHVGANKILFESVPGHARRP